MCVFTFVLKVSWVPLSLRDLLLHMQPFPFPNSSGFWSSSGAERGINLLDPRQIRAKPKPDLGQIKARRGPDQGQMWARSRPNLLQGQWLS